MKQTKDKPTETALEENVDPVGADRSAAIEATLQPLNLALDTLRSEASAFTEASERHSERIAKLQRKKSTYEQKHAEMLELEKDEDLEAIEELHLSIGAAKKAAETVGDQLAKAQSEAPGDYVVQESWRNLEANFDELHWRIVRYHNRVAQEEIERIERIRDESNSRVYLKLNTGDIAMAERAIDALAGELGNVDVALLDPYKDPQVEAAEAAEASAREAAEASARRAEYGKMLRQSRFTPPPDPNAKSSLFYPNDHDYFPMATRLQEAEERNAKQLAEWQEEGTAPRNTRQL